MPLKKPTIAILEARDNLCTDSNSVSEAWAENTGVSRAVGTQMLTAVGTHGGQNPGYMNVGCASQEDWQRKVQTVIYEGLVCGATLTPQRVREAVRALTLTGCDSLDSLSSIYGDSLSTGITHKYAAANANVQERAVMSGPERTVALLIKKVRDEAAETNKILRKNKPTREVNVREGMTKCGLDIDLMPERLRLAQDEYERVMTAIERAQRPLPYIDLKTMMPKDMSFIMGTRGSGTQKASAELLNEVAEQLDEAAGASSTAVATAYENVILRTAQQKEGQYLASHVQLALLGRLMQAFAVCGSLNSAGHNGFQVIWTSLHIIVGSIVLFVSL
jgi:hypothetical protein